MTTFSNHNLKKRKSLDSKLQKRRNRGFLRKLGTAIVSLSILGGTFFTSQLASAAKIPRILRPGTRPMAFNFGLGGSFGIGHNYHRYYDGPYNGYYGPYGGPGYYGYNRARYGYDTFKLTQEFIYHFSGSAKGPALGALLQEDFPGYPNFGLTIAPKFVWDIQIVKNLGFYISPDVSLGYHGYFGPGSFHAADLQFGVSAKLMLNDRWVVWLQTPHFDLQIYRGGYVLARYDLLLGAGVTF